MLQRNLILRSTAGQSLVVGIEVYKTRENNT
jgi:hypothetical protein